MDLSNSSLTDAEAAQLAGALRGNAQLRSLNLEFNELDGAGLAAIADALRGNTVLTCVTSPLARALDAQGAECGGE
jgi:hypothetical protein